MIQQDSKVWWRVQGERLGALVVRNMRHPLLDLAQEGPREYVSPLVFVETLMPIEALAMPRGLCFYTFLDSLEEIKDD